MEAGGRTFFGCTYKQYLNVENGQSAPGPETLEKIATALHVWFNDSQAREFFIAYLRTVLRSRELLEMALRALAVPPGGPTPLRQAIQKDFQNRRFRVTQAQAAAMYSSYAHYWISNVFCNDNGEWSAEELARLLGLEPPAVRKALSDFVKNGFLSTAGNSGRYRCRAAGKVFVMPRKDPHVVDPQALRGREMLEKMASRTGVEEMFHGQFLRASSAALKQYYPFLAQAVVGCDVYSSPNKGADTAMFVVEARVRRLFPF